MAGEAARNSNGAGLSFRPPLHRLRRRTRTPGRPRHVVPATGRSGERCRARKNFSRNGQRRCGARKLSVGLEFRAEAVPPFPKQPARALRSDTACEVVGRRPGLAPSAPLGNKALGREHDPLISALFDGFYNSRTGEDVAGPHAVKEIFGG